MFLIDEKKDINKKVWIKEVFPMNCSRRFLLYNKHQLRIFIIFGFIILMLLNGCGFRKSKDEEALGNVRSIAVYFNIDHNFTHAGRDFYFPPPSIISEDNTEALKNANIFHTKDTLIFKLIDPFELLKGNKKVYQIDKKSKRTFFSRELINRLNNDAILWITINYGSQQDTPSYEADSGFAISPYIIWFGELYDKNGKKIWADSISKSGDSATIIGTWMENQIGTTVNKSLNLYWFELIPFNKKNAGELSSKLLGILTGDIKQAQIKYK